MAARAKQAEITKCLARPGQRIPFCIAQDGGISGTSDLYWTSACSRKGFCSAVVNGHGARCLVRNLSLLKATQRSTIAVVTSPARTIQNARIASLHLHPALPGAALTAVQSIELIAGKGISGNPRYFGRVSKSTGKASRRQVSLIEREQIAEHAAALGLEKIAPGRVRANIETEGVNLISLVGQQIQIGAAILHLYEPREPCEKMDAICQGLRERMQENRQGVMAEVLQSGRIQVGDAIQ